MTDNKEKSSFWHRGSSKDEDYWTTYLAARPKYTDDFYKSILEYHTSHGNPDKTVAIDVGAGPGQVAEAFSKHFAHVIVNEPSEQHIEIARDRLAHLAAESKVSFVRSKGEDVNENCPDIQADMILAAECMALLNPPLALSAFHKTLRPGGTLAIWFYGRPHFVHPSGAAWDTTCNVAYSRLVDVAHRELSLAALASSPDADAAWKLSWGIMDSHLDSVAVPSSDWENVERTKWNCDDAVEFAFWRPPGVEKVMASAVGGHESVESVQDWAFWGEEWGMEEARRFIAVNMPSFKPEVLESEDCKGLVEELEKAMGGKGGRRKVTWPVVRILATKK